MKTPRKGKLPYKKLIDESVRETLSTPPFERTAAAQGQRSVSGDAYEWAVRYANEFLTTKKVVDQPGEKLDKEITDEV